MKIILVGSGLLPIPPNGYGAVEKHIHYLSQSLIKRGNDVEVWNDVVGSEYRWAGTVGRRLNHYKYRNYYDIIHTHTSFIGAYLATFHETVYTSHSPMWTMSRKGPRERWGLLLDRRAVSKSKQVIALTSRIKQLMAKERQKGGISVIPNGVDTEFYKVDYTYRYNIGSRSNYKICMLGKIVRRKNFHIVAEAVNGMDIDCELHIIGTQPDSTYVQELTKINPNIVFHQNITDQALAYLLTYMDIFVHPSGSEAMSMAVLEAMASGLPIICSPVCEEQVGGAGFIVNSKRPKQWRLAVEAILQNPQAYHSLSAESRRLAETKYSWDVVAQQVEQVYKWAVQV